MYQQHKTIIKMKNGDEGETVIKAIAWLDKKGETFENAHSYIARINELIEIKNVKTAEREAIQKADEDREQRRRDARANRDETNAQLRASGYFWHKEDDDGYQSAYDFGDSQWHLMSPDHYEVTVAEALEDIKRGVDVAIAERAAAAEKPDHLTGNPYSDNYEEAFVTRG